MRAPMLGAAVVELLVVLPQEVPTVVVAVWRSHHRVDVAPRGFVLVEHDPAPPSGFSRQPIFPETS